MAIKRVGIAGSALGTSLLAMLLFGSPGSGPASLTTSGQTEATSPMAAQGNEKTNTPPKRVSTPKRDAPERTTEILRARQVLLGPWIASQKHFAGTNRVCPPQIYAEYAIPTDTVVTLPNGTILVTHRSPDPTSKASLNQLWCIPKGQRVRAMISIVPDPLQTHMSLSFDRTVEAIQLAAASSKYVIDRYWLPWDIDQKADWIDYDSFKQAIKVQKQKESQPGLLIFRWNDKESRHDDEKGQTTALYVFLVGETSTAGINGEQFANAARYASLINDICCTPRMGLTDQTPSVFVMGPSFSNSLKSLRRLVDAHTFDFTIYSGTVSSCKAKKDARFGEPSFYSFVRPTEEILSQFVKTVPNHKDNTGNAADNSCEENISDGKENGCGENKSPDVAILSEAVTIGERWNKLCVDSFQYSREISTLRNAYPASTVKNSPTKDAIPEPSSLTLNLTDQTNSSDEPPDFSKVQSPLSKEAVLMNFAAQMRRNHYRYIGIITTSPLDAAFLTKFLRREVPDARLFQMDSDALLEHEPDYTSYLGMLSLTTYPMLDRRLNPTFENDGQQHEDKQPLRYLPFETQFEKGLYNATVCLIRKVLGGDHADSKIGQLSERAECPNPKAKQPKIPLWLTTVGTGGHWPVEVIDGQVEPPPTIGNPPASWEALCALLCVLAFLHIFILLGFAPFSPKFRDFTLGTVATRQQLFGIHSASATLALALALTAVSARSAWSAWSAWEVIFGTLIPGFFIIALIATCLLLTRKYIRWRATGRTNGQNAGSLRSSIAMALLAMFLPWIASAWLAYQWWTLLSDKRGHYGRFFSYRAVHLTSIVSPLMPMLFLLTVVYLAAIFYMWHLRFNDKTRPRLNPDPKRRGEDKLRPGWRSEDLIAKAINDSIPALWAAGIFGTWLLVFKPIRFAPFEHSGFQWVYTFLFCIVVFLIVLSGYRLSLIWRKLRRLLLELNRQRISIVFSRLKGEDWPSIWFYGSEDADWDYMVRSEEIIKQLTSSSASPAVSRHDDYETIKKIRRQRRDLQEKLQDEKLSRRVLNTFTVGDHDQKIEEIERHLYRAQNYLATTLHSALDTLEEIWKTQPPWIEDDDEPTATNGVVVLCCKKEPDKPIRWQKIIEEYVALRYEAFIRGVLARIRSLVIFLPLSFTLALTSLIIYPFEPHRELIWSLTALFVGIGFIMVTVLMQMHRDSIMSRITGTKPNELGFTFFVRVATLGIGPLVTLLATHYPSISRYVLSFLQPGLEALKR